MNASSMVTYLKNCVNISEISEDGDSSLFLHFTDEELEGFLEVVKSRNYYMYPSLDALPPECDYPLMLLAKKELLYAMCTRLSVLYDLGADNNNYLKRSQMFDKIMALIKQTDIEYGDYIDEDPAGTGGTLTSYSVLLPNRYNTRYNYEHGVVPNPQVFCGDLLKDSVLIYWRVTLSRFRDYRVYLSKEPILELVRDGKYNEEPLCVIDDIHENFCRIEDLEPDTTYFATVQVSEMSGLSGYNELQFTTLIGDSWGDDNYV